MEFRRLSSDINFRFSENNSKEVATKIHIETEYKCIQHGACYNFYKDGRLVENNQPMHYLCMNKDKFYGQLGALLFEIVFLKITQETSKYAFILNPNETIMLGQTI